MNTMLVICGPTATGKTALALYCAKKCNGELVSADSRQVYRGMNIGTGKDIGDAVQVKSKAIEVSIKDKTYFLVPYEVDGVLLWMLDVVDPDELFSVFLYQKLSYEIIANIRKRGKLPIIVGGTGLYISSLLSPIETSHIPRNETLRKKLDHTSLLELQVYLQQCDLPTWDGMNDSDRQNSRRLVRKIEIAAFKRDTKTGGLEDSKTVRMEEAFIIGLTASYPFLYERIDARVEKRVQEGIISEISSLLKKGYSWDLPSMNTFGYKEWNPIFTLNLQLTANNVQPIIQRWKFDEHAYARRQKTWFKKQHGIRWFDVSEPKWQEQVETVVHQWYTKYIQYVHGEYVC